MRWRCGRFFSGAAVILALAGGAHLLRMMRDPLPTDGVRETRLPNGLTVLTREMHGFPVVAVRLTYRAGVGYERPGIRGISHLLEHVTFRGTHKRATGEIHRTLYVNGADYNGFTGLDATRYYESVGSDRLETVLDLEADRMQNCRLDADDIDRERRVLRSELEEREADPRERLLRAVARTAYPHHPYGWAMGDTAVGSEGDLGRITREELARYYRTHYVPNRAVLILAGDFSTAAALRQVREKFGPIPRGPEEEAPAPLEAPQTAERRVEIRGRGGTPTVMLAYRSPAAGSPDWYSLDLLTQSLARPGAGWLSQRLLDRHAGAEVECSAITRRDPNLITFRAAAPPGVPVETLEREMRAGLDDVSRGQLPEAELEAARRALSATQLQLQDSPPSIAYMLDSWWVTDGWRGISTYLDSIRRLRRSEVTETARRYFRSETLTVGIYRPKLTGTPAPPAQSSEAEGEEPPAAAGIPSAPAKILPAQPRPLSVARWTLPNGMTVLVHETSGSPTFAMAGFLPAGHVFDLRSTPGLATMTARMLYHTRQRDGRQMLGYLNSLGAEITTDAGSLTADFNGRGPVRSFSDTAGLLSEMLRVPRFTQADLDYLRPQVASGLERVRSDPGTEAEARFQELFRPWEDPLRSPSADEVQAALASMRAQQVELFYQQQYGPDHLILAISGGVSTAEVRRVVDRYFRKWPRNTAARPLPARLPEPESRSQRCTISAGGAEDRVVWGASSGVAPGAADESACDVLQTILVSGGPFQSRLGRRIREERSLVYRLTGKFDTTLYPGPLRVSFGADPRSAGRAVRLLEQEVRRVQTEGVTQREVDEAVAHRIASVPVGLATNPGMAHALASAAFYGHDTNLAVAAQRRYASVTRDQVNAAARAHLHPEQAIVVVVGPKPASGSL